MFAFVSELLRLTALYIKQDVWVGENGITLKPGYGSVEQFYLTPVTTWEGGAKKEAVQIDLKVRSTVHFIDNPRADYSYTSLLANVREFVPFTPSSLGVLR